MSLLLDTCVFLWLTGGVGRLFRRADQLIKDSANRLYLSVVSAWEIGVLYGLGKVQLHQTPDVFVPAGRAAYHIAELILEEADAALVHRLPPWHRDPFDRMLVCQAWRQQLTILTPDPRIQQYAVPTDW